MKNHSNIALILSFLLGGFTFGQESKIALRVMALNDIEMPDRFLKVGAEYLRVEFSSIQPSDAISAQYANPLPLYEERLEGDKTEYIISDRVALPENSRGVLLLGWRNGEKTQYVGLKDDFFAAKNTDWLLVNTTSRPMAIQLGKGTKAMSIAPSGVTPCHIVSGGDGGIPVSIAEERGEKWKIFYSTYWPIYPDKRCIILFYSEGEKISVKMISDVTSGVVKKEAE